MKTILTTTLLLASCFITLAENNSCLIPFDKESNVCVLEMNELESIDKLWFTLDQCTGNKQDSLFASSFDVYLLVNGVESTPEETYYSRFENGLFDKFSRTFLLEQAQNGSQIIFTNIKIEEEAEQKASKLTIHVGHMTATKKDASTPNDDDNNKNDNHETDLAGQSDQNEDINETIIPALERNTFRTEDSCHSLLDINTRDGNYPNNRQATLSLDKIKKLQTLCVTYDFCEDKADDLESYISKVRIIFAPAHGPAKMMMLNGYELNKTYYEILENTNLISGDRIIFEGVEYIKDKQKYVLSPLIIVVE